MERSIDKLYSSTDLAKALGSTHSKVVRLIKPLVDQLAEGFMADEFIVEPAELTYRGNDYSGYVFNQAFYDLIAMRSKGAKPLSWQMQYIVTRYLLEEHLAASDSEAANVEWLTAQEQIDAAKKLSITSTEEFLDYAQKQGATTAFDFLAQRKSSSYCGLELIFFLFPTLKGTLGITSTSSLMLAEQLVQRSLRKYMDLGRNYKDVYVSVKEDLIKFVSDL